MPKSTSSRTPRDGSLKDAPYNNTRKKIRLAAVAKQTEEAAAKRDANAAVADQHDALEDAHGLALAALLSVFETLRASMPRGDTSLCLRADLKRNGRITISNIDPRRIPDPIAERRNDGATGIRLKLVQGADRCHIFPIASLETPRR